MPKAPAQQAWNASVCVWWGGAGVTEVVTLELNATTFEKVGKRDGQRKKKSANELSF